MNAFTLRLAAVPSALGTSEAGRRRLRIFLHDHLAALTAATALVRRTLKENRDTPLGRVLAPIHLALQEDLLHLRRASDALGIPRPRLRIAAALIAERLGRLKFNGQLRGYSPLSRVHELEALIMLTAHRAILWRVLERHRQLDRRLDAFDPAARAELAEHQQSLLERELVQASLDAF